MKISSGMNKIKKFLVLLIIIFFSSTLVSAEENPIEDPVIVDTNTLIHLTILSGENTLYDQNINVEACESDNPASSNLKITPYCAILQSGLTNTWNFTWAPGIFLDSINDITGSTSQDAEGNPIYSYWSWSLNNVEAMVGLNQYELLENDLITLTFIDPLADAKPEIIPEPNIIPKISSSSSSSSQKITKIEEKFDLEKAFNFLIKNQKENGSFGPEMQTDWATLALISSDKYLNEKVQLYKYYFNNKLENRNLTDYERRSMALLSLGLNPYNINGENYIQEIIKNFDGKQFGSLAEVNDDFFAILILNKVGYDLKDLEIKNSIDFILTKQNKNGSWNNSIDLTSAGIISLINFQTDEKIYQALNQAKKFLKENQEENGAWQNSFSTAWTLGAISALKENINDWSKNKENPITYLTKNQINYEKIEPLELPNKIWEISYILTALSEKSWNEIMQNFPKEISTEKINPKKETKNKTPIENSSIPKENLESQPIITEKINKEDSSFKKVFKKILNILF